MSSWFVIGKNSTNHIHKSSLIFPSFPSSHLRRYRRYISPVANSGRKGPRWTCLPTLFPTAHLWSRFARPFADWRSYHEGLAGHQCETEALFIQRIPLMLDGFWNFTPDSAKTERKQMWTGKQNQVAIQPIFQQTPVVSLLVSISNSP